LSNRTKVGNPLPLGMGAGFNGGRPFNGSKSAKAAPKKSAPKKSAGKKR